MANWIDVGAAEEMAPEGKSCVAAGEVSVVVCRVEEHFVAIRNICPHAGLPLGEGSLQGRVLTCPFHVYAYDVETGKNIDFEEDVPLSQCPVRVTEAGRVEVDVEASE